MSFRVTNSEIEGQHPLVRVTPVILIKTRVALAVLLSLLTGLLFALFLKWSNKLYNNFLFHVVSDEAIGTHYRVDTQAGQQFTCKKQFLNGLSIFNFRLLKYTFNAQTQTYFPLEFESEGKVVQQIYDERNVLPREMKFHYYGSCQLKIPVEPPQTYFFQHLTGPFNILQYFAVAVWFAQGTVQQPILILAFTAAAICLNYFLYRRSRHLLQQLANIHTNISLKDGETIRNVNGADIVPGDLIILQEGAQMNCDCAIVQGDVMVNEATLTGESVPIPKNAVPDFGAKFNFEKLNQHCLFEGTKLVKVNSTQQNVALVLRTGFTSLRGQYFRNVLFPEPPSIRFYKQAAKFILCFALLIVIIYLANLRNYLDLEYSTELLVLRFLDNIVWSIPPSLPVLFSICKTASLARLGNSGVMGSNADKVEAAGRVDTCCFDKTGTLTTLGLKAQKAWTPTLELDIIAKYIMGCCHHLMKINNELLGDPLEVEMFDYVGWKIEFEGHSHFSVTDGNINFEILKVFDFSSERQMMSVIAFDGNKHYLFSKGSPEMVNFNSTTKKKVILDEVHQYASNGFRVIGLGYRELSKEQLEMQREQIECQLEFVGIFILENPLKPDTGDVIKILKSSGLDIKVISGDSPLTTIYCAKTSNIIDFETEVILLDYNPNTKIVNITEQGVNTQYPDILQNPQILFDTISSPHNTAMTGKFLEFLSKYQTESQEEKEQRVNTSVNQTNQIFVENNQIEIVEPRMNEILMKLIAKTKVFARQKPDQKKQIVYLLQKLDRQVLMCGDGANDCSAIAQAHIGISFSESDASYTAPFSSKTTSLSCCIKVLAQGKAAIMIIIEVFQYTLSVNGIKFISVILMLMEGETYSDFQFTFVGFITTIPLMIFLCFSSPSDVLSSYIPLDDQFAYQNQLQIYSVMIWGSVGLLINYGLLRNMHRVVNISQPIEKYIRSGVMNSVMFVSVCFYFMTFGIILYVSKPFKQSYYRNLILAVWTLAWLIIAIIQILAPQTGSWCGLIDYRDDQTWSGFEWVVLAVVSCTSIVGYIVQVILQQYLSSTIKITH